MVKFAPLGMLALSLLSLNTHALSQEKTNTRIRDTSLDLSGYYLPTSKLRLGQFELYHLSFGTPEELKAYEQQGQSIKTWTPFMLVFEDMSSPEVIGETGIHRENMPSVFCQSYTISLKLIECEGYNSQIGRVRFVGKIDPSFARQKVRSDVVSSKPVLTGTLYVGRYKPRQVAMTFYMGD